MRRVLMMVFAVVACMGLGTTGVLAADTAPKKKCKAGDVRKGGKCVLKLKKCKLGEEKVIGRCVPKPSVPKPDVPKPVPCDPGEEKVDGKCVPSCKDDEIYVDGRCVPRPKDGPCAKADLVLLEDLFKGTGALLCVYLGDNAPNASSKPGGDCPEALLALPLDNLVGVCLYLPPADVTRLKAPSGKPLSLPTPTGAARKNGLSAVTGGAGLEELRSTLARLVETAMAPGR